MWGGSELRSADGHDTPVTDTASLWQAGTRMPPRFSVGIGRSFARASDERSDRESEMRMSQPDDAVDGRNVGPPPKPYNTELLRNEPWQNAREPMSDVPAGADEPST